jgi:hypothetical protein
VQEQQQMLGTLPELDGNQDSEVREGFMEITDEAAAGGDIEIRDDDGAPAEGAQAEEVAATDSQTAGDTQVEIGQGSAEDYK